MTSAPSRRTPPVAVSKRTGMPVRIRRIARSVSTPITESCGPGHPDVRQRGRPAGKHAGVGRLDVRVRPEHRGDPPVEPRASATFSLVASAWTSTTTTGVAAARLLDEVVDDLPHAVRRLEEERAEHVDDGDRRSVARGDDGRARGPAQPSWKLAGRTTAREEAR